MYKLCHHHHQILQAAQSSPTFACNPSLAFIAPARSSRLHLMSAQN